MKQERARRAGVAVARRTRRDEIEQRFAYNESRTTP